MGKFTPEIKNKGACRNMWTVVYMAQSKEIAVNLQKFLTDEGILVKLRPISKDEEKSNDYFEILVPEAEIEEAHGVIIDKGY
jgi:hypothetical protein